VVDKNQCSVMIENKWSKESVKEKKRIMERTVDVEWI
jgi:hypothetical protein